MSDGLDQLCAAGAKLLNSVATALDSYTELQKRRFDYALQQVPQEQKSGIEQFQPGYFEEQYAARARHTDAT